MKRKNEKYGDVLGCRNAWYCGKECQRKAWKLYHRRECERCKAETDEELKRIFSETTMDEIRLACFILWRREGEEKESEEKEVKYEDVETLVSHFEEICGKGREREMRRLATRDVAKAVIMRKGRKKKMKKERTEEEKEEEIEEIEKILCRMQCNDFGIWDYLIMTNGAGVFPAGAMVNHSCEGTTVVTY